jgi:DNA-binding IclR family transcriptional regulator
MSEIATHATDGAVPRAFAVLELLAHEQEPTRLSAIALKLGMQKSTVHRILATLTSLGYVEQVASTGCYRATLRLWEIGSGLIAHHRIKQAATVFLQRLHAATRQTVSLTILSGDDVLYLDKIISPRPTRFTSRVGSRVPAPLTAGGKAILAYEPHARAIIQRAMPHIKEKRRVGVDAMLRELADVRRNGYAVSRFRPGVVSFGAPILSRSGRAAAALSVSAETRLPDARHEAIIEELLSTCAEIAESVGHL